VFSICSACDSGSTHGSRRAVLSRFTKLVGAERLRRIIDEKVVMLLRRSNVREVDVVLDASFIKAWSIRHPRDSRRGFSGRPWKSGAVEALSPETSLNLFSHYKDMSWAFIMIRAREPSSTMLKLTRARHVYEKVGYSAVGCVPKYNLKDGVYIDNVIMAKEL